RGGLRDREARRPGLRRAAGRAAGAGRRADPAPGRAAREARAHGAPPRRGALCRLRRRARSRRPFLPPLRSRRRARGPARLSPPAIAARGLEKRFGFALALAGIDLDVPAGATLAVLGSNGAGKSTLLRLFAGLARPSAGSVEIAGRRAHGREARAQVGLI